MSRALQLLSLCIQRRCRGKRAELFRRYLRPSAQDHILDLGGGYGDYFATVVPFRERVWIAEIDEAILRRARRRGFQTALIPTDGSLPFPDRHFDIVHCNSVIEHVPGSEERARLAAEIQRVGRTWFVQTPNRYFVIESHTRMPFGQFLPRPLLRACLPYLARLWGYHDQLDWKLLDARELLTLFPRGELIRERFLGLTKSLLVIGGERVPHRESACTASETVSPSPTF